MMPSSGDQVMPTARPAYQRGDVIYVPFRYAELTGGKVRPAVVVSSAAFYAAEGCYIVAAITSNVAASGPLSYQVTDLTAAGLSVPSVVRPVLLTLSPEVMGRRVGALVLADLESVAHCLRQALELT
jgi:mRNA-degrading endonuclease toxin of MazEF toxin-antitoxin module